MCSFCSITLVSGGQLQSNGPLSSSRGSVNWYRNYGMRTRLIAKSFSSIKKWSVVVEKTSKNFSNFIEGEWKNYSWERLKSKVMAEIIHNSLIYARKLQQRSRSKLPLHPKTAKTFEGEITNNWRQISNTKISNAWTYHFSNVPELSLDVRMQRCLTCSDVTI